MAETLADFARQIGITPQLARQWKKRGRIVEGNECWWLACPQCAGRFAGGGCNVFCSDECAEGRTCGPCHACALAAVAKGDSVTESVTIERDGGVTVLPAVTEQPERDKSVTERDALPSFQLDYHEWCEALELVNSLKARIIALEDRVVELESKRDSVKEWDRLPPARNTSDSFPPWGA